MKWKGIELKEITEPQIFAPPKKMLVWDDGFLDCYEKAVSAITKQGSFVWLCDKDAKVYDHCAEIPEAPKPRMATWKELAYWLMDAKGLVLDEETKNVDTGVYFPKGCLDEYISGRWKVMRRDDTEWHEPDVQYMGIEAAK